MTWASHVIYSRFMEHNSIRITELRNHQQSVVVCTKGCGKQDPYPEHMYLSTMLENVTIWQNYTFTSNAKLHIHFQPPLEVRARGQGFSKKTIGGGGLIMQVWHI